MFCLNNTANFTPVTGNYYIGLGLYLDFRRS